MFTLERLCTRIALVRTVHQLVDFLSTKESCFRVTKDIRDASKKSKCRHENVR